MFSILKTIFVLMFGRFCCPKTYERYILAVKLVQQKRQWCNIALEKHECCKD